MGKISETITGYPFSTGDELSSKSLNEITEALDGIDTKQDIITDLDDIRSGAELGETAVQPDALNNYYTKNETDGKLVAKQDVLTAGDNIQITNNVISATDTKYVAGDFDIKDLSDTDGLRTKWDSAATLVETAVQESGLETTLTNYYTSGVTNELLDAKQDALTAGANIEISANTISVVGLDSDKYPIITWNNNNSATIKPNTYNIWNSGTYPTQLTLDTPLNDKIVNEYIIRFTIPSTVSNYSLIFYDELIKWADNNIPVWEPNCTYFISIIDGYAVFLKYFEGNV